MCLALCSMTTVSAQQKYDFLLKGGHVIDPRNEIRAVRDVAIANGKVAAVAANINPVYAFKVVNASGYYVTPGLVDIHVHVYAGTGERGSYAGDNSLYPDGFTLRAGITTIVDAGSSGWVPAALAPARATISSWPAGASSTIRQRRQTQRAS